MQYGWRIFTVKTIKIWIIPHSFSNTWLMVYFTLYVMKVLIFTGTRTVAAVRLFLTVMLTWWESLLPSSQLNPMISHFRALPSAPLVLHCTAPLLLHSSPVLRLRLHPSFFFLFPHVHQPLSAIRPHTARLMLMNTYGHSLSHSHTHIQYI